MRCVLCDGRTEEKSVDYKEWGVSLGRYKAHVCQKCNETYFDEETAGKIQKRSKELGLFGMTKKTRVAEVGNSLAIRIPKEIAKFLDLKKGQEITIQPKDKHGLQVLV